MSSILIQNIGQLIQIRESDERLVRGLALDHLPTLNNAYLHISDGKIADFGPQKDCPEALQFNESIEKIDATGSIVMPTFVDAHTHLVFADYRADEFEDRLRGKSYEEIAENGGGILNSAIKTQRATEDELYASAWERLNEIIGLGTGAVEIKSGYGLTVESEIKLLRVVKRLKEHSPIPIRATFLGAHAFPTKYKQNRSAYIDLIIEEILPMIEKEGLADYVDVFCETGFFTPEESDQVLKAGIAHGLKPRVHANELDLSGGVQVGVANGALSVDHLECMSEAEINALQNSETIPMLLPSTAFFLNIEYANARAMIEADLPVGLSTDYNPGTSPSGSMPMVLSIACTQMKMTPAEAINAATMNSAAAIEHAATHGSITRGKTGSVIITKPVNSVAYLPYAFGTRWIRDVIIAGRAVKPQ